MAIAACLALSFSKPALPSSDPPVSKAPAPSWRSKARDATLLPAALSFSKPALPSSNPPVSAAPVPSSLSKGRNVTLLPAALSFSKPALPTLLAAATTGGLWSSRGGVGILERPRFDQSPFDLVPEAQEGGNDGIVDNVNGLQMDGPSSYKVLLLDHPMHTEKLVVRSLPLVLSMTPDRARELYYEAQEKGSAVVIVAAKEYAEAFAHNMRRYGVRSKIEPN